MTPSLALFATLARVRAATDPAARYTVPQAAALFGVGVGAVKDWIAAGHLAATRAGAAEPPFQVGQWLVPGSELVRLARERAAGRVRVWRRRASA